MVEPLCRCSPRRVLSLRDPRFQLGPVGEPRWLRQAAATVDDRVGDLSFTVLGGSMPSHSRTMLTLSKPLMALLLPLVTAAVGCGVKGTGSPGEAGSTGSAGMTGGAGMTGSA